MRMFKAGDGRLAGCGCRLHEEASRLALRKKTKGIFHLEKKQKQCFAPTDKKNLLRKNHKGRWTTYTLNVASEADDLPWFSQDQSSGQDASNPTVDPTVSDQVTHQSDQVAHQSDQVTAQVTVKGGEEWGEKQGEAAAQVTAQITAQVTAQVTAQAAAQVTAQVCCICSIPKSAKEIMSELGLRHWKNFQERTLNPLLALGVIERTQPDSPRSPTQKYRLTEKGRAFLKLNEGDKVLSGKP